MVFSAPLLLLGLLALPAIWWLLRLTPPKPNTEIFPPLRLLAKLIKQEETPSKSPWWLTALRLLMAALVIFALARPLLNPQTASIDGDGPVLVMVDNGWARPGDFDARLSQARQIVEEAASAGRPVAVTTTVAPTNANVQLDTLQNTLAQLEAIQPIAATPDRSAAWARLITALDGEAPQNAELVLLSDGLAHHLDDDQSLLGDQPAPGSFSIYTPDATQSPIIALAGASNGAQSLVADIAQTGNAQAEGRTVTAYDERGRPVANAAISSNSETDQLTAEFSEPFQLRNDFVRLQIDGERTASAVHLLDDSDRRRRVALLTGVSSDVEQPLLSPLFYIRRAIEPFTDIIEGRTGDLAVDLPEMIEQGPAMLVMADIGVVPEQAQARVLEWVDAGGTLVRFAGPRLAAQTEEDPLLAVRIRLGERSLTGALSWTEPQPVAAFPSNSPFADLNAPDDVSVERQILAEPDANLNERTWAILADGTPLVTGRQQGRGSLVLFHVTAEATWSNLPISGTFVEMLRRIADASSNTQSTSDTSAIAPSGEGANTYAPSRILSVDGQLLPPTGSVEPLTEATLAAGMTNFAHPAGLYGDESAFAALNAVQTADALDAISSGLATLPNAQTVPYPTAFQTSLTPWLFAAALALLFFDTLAVLWINGRLSRATLRPAGATIALMVFVGVVSFAPHASAQGNGNQTLMDEQTAIELVDQTRLAYVITGATATDDVTRAGLDGLSRFIASRTALEPGDPVGVSLETDELAFYPLIYYAIDTSAPQPSDAAIARLDAYMQNGGTVLFDTRDDLGNSINAQSAENAYLRDLLRNLNVPALEPVPPDHVLTKSFYILETFPGRYAGSPLWIEALPQGTERVDRPVRSGDGVSPILITGNDFASAWALDEAGMPIAAMSGGNPLQRIYAFRTGVNIVMYMLTGNYKADQVHIPALLERLGQ